LTPSSQVWLVLTRQIRFPRGAATVFLQYGSQEKFLNPERARAYASIVSEPKQFKEYDAPHALNAEARRDRITS